MFYSHAAAKWYCITLTILLFAALAVPSHAVPMKVTGGFDGVAKNGTWTPIAVELENSDSRTVEGVLEIRQGDWSVPVCTADVEMPANSKKRYHVYARLREYGDVYVNLRSGDRILATQKASFNFATMADTTVVSVGDRSSQLGFMNHEQLGAKSPPAPGSPPQSASVFVGSLPVASLPDRPAAYEGVDVLVISSLPISSASPRALEALSMWVASGGTLVVSTGPDYRSFQNDFFNEMLPVRITGAGQISTTASLQRMGGGAFPSASMAVATSTPKPGIASRVVMESGIPIYAERTYGAGRVVFLAFDHLSSPFKDWNGQVVFWKNIISSETRGVIVHSKGRSFYQQEQYPPYQMSQHRNNLVGVVQQNPSIKMPQFSTIALFLLGYIVVLVPVNYFILHRLRRRELAWVTTPAIVLIFTVGAYGIGYTMKGGRLQINQASFIEASGNARYAYSVSEASIFSPASRSYDISLSDPYALGQTLGSSDDEAFPTAAIGEHLAIKDLRMAMWSSKTLESTSGVDLGGRLETDLKLVGSKLVGTIRNNTGLDLADCVLMWGDNSVIVDGLHRGGSASVSIESVPTHSVYPGEPAWQNAPKLADRFRSFVNGAVSMGGRPMLLARSSDRRLVEIVGGRAHTESCAYVAFDLDYDMGNRFAVSPSSIPGKITLTDQPNGYGESGTGRGVFLNLFPGRYAVISYRVPVQPNSVLTSLSIALASSSDGEAAPDGGPAPAPVTNEVYKIYDPVSRKWDAVKPGSDIPNPARYMSASGEVRIKIMAIRSNFTGYIGISACGRIR